MKKVILFAFLAIFSLCAFAITPDSKSKSEKPVIPAKKEYKMSDEEINNLVKRSEEFRGLDKSQQTVVVQEEHGRRRRDHDGTYRDNPRHGSVVFIGGGAVLLLIILLIILV